MRVSRKLSDDLVVQLTRARDLEAAAGSTEQRRSAYKAASALMLAAADAGWLIVDIADAMGLRRTPRRSGSTTPGDVAVMPLPA